MKGQFMIISTMIIGLIVISVAGVIAGSQIQQPKINYDSHKITSIKKEAQKVNTSSPKERRNFKILVESLREYDSNTTYWNSQNCFNITLENYKNKYYLNCVG
ncbi:MAG: hypothetical protein ABEJ83_05620 [Candidatus Nanohaloarchaea archaeon]